MSENENRDQATPEEMPQNQDQTDAAEDAAQAASGGADGQPVEAKEPSLGPAILVIAILSLAVFTSVCAFGSWFVFSDQYPLAKSAIESQLIPWVDQSQLRIEDKESIALQLQSLLPVLENEEISKEQLLRLRNCLQDNPVLLWGGIQSIVAQAADSDLTPTEKSSVQRLSDRLLRMAAERKLGRSSLEYTIQNCSKVREDKSGLEVMSNLTEKQIRNFMERAEQLVEQNEIPNEPYEKSPAEVFELLLENALQIPPSRT